jgi:hypothetical protein
MPKTPIQWLAHYSDGTNLQQFERERENKYTDIDRAKLTAFALTHYGVPILMIHFDRPGQRLIYRRRVFVRPGEEPEVYVLAGWQMTIGGENVQSICVVNEAGVGGIDVISRWNDNHPLFGSVQFIAEEECESN